MDNHIIRSNKKIKFSVIIAVLNCDEFLEGALQSVFSQTYPDIEVIVIDGGSVDGTVDIIKRYDDQICYWSSEKDEGTSEAFNKGLKKSRGDFVVLLCADDWFSDDKIFEYLSQIIESHPQADVIHAPIKLVDRKTGQFLIDADSDIKGMTWRMALQLPGAFIRRSIVADRLFDMKFKYANDYDMFLFLLKVKKANFLKIDKVYIKFRTGGMSRAEKDTLVKCKEHLLIARRYFGFLHAFALLPVIFLSLFSAANNFHPLRYVKKNESLMEIEMRMARLSKLKMIFAQL